MGVLYGIYPMLDWVLKELRRHRIAPPEATESRRATPSDVRHALAGLDGYYVEFVSDADGWQAYVSDAPPPDDHEFALLVALGFVGDEAAQTDFYFEKGDPELNVRILERLTASAAPWPSWPTCPPFPRSSPPALTQSGSMPTGNAAWRNTKKGTPVAPSRPNRRAGPSQHRPPTHHQLPLF